MRWGRRCRTDGESGDGEVVNRNGDGEQLVGGSHNGLEQSALSAFVAIWLVSLQLTAHFAICNGQNVSFLGPSVASK